MEKLTDDLRDEARTAWHIYLDSLNPFRPQLFGYCRKLTRDVFDAEDLVHDTLIRGFASLGVVHQPIENPRAYLLRIATNLWIDQVRRREREGAILEAGEGALPVPEQLAAAPDRSVDLREAGATLMSRLIPQERAAVVLKDVFDLSLDETATILSTTSGTVKSALHRARGRLQEEVPAARARRRTASPEIVDRFMECLDAKDLGGLLEMMLDTGSVQTGYLLEVGRGQFSAKGGWLWSACHGHPNRPKALDAWKLRHERREHRGESLVLAFSDWSGDEGLNTVMRIHETGGRIACIEAHSDPDFVRALGEELALPVTPFPVYRPPTPGPGKEWPRIGEDEGERHE